MPAAYANLSIHNILSGCQRRPLGESFTGGLGAAVQSATTSHFYTKNVGLADNNVTVLAAAIVTGQHVDRHLRRGLSRMTGKKMHRLSTTATENISTRSTLCSQEDQEGDMWVGARDGLHQLRPRRFLAYTRQQGLQHNNVTSVMEDKEGSIWFGTWGGGLARMKDGEINNYTWENNPANGLSSDLILSMYEDRDGSLIIGTDYEGGTFRFSGGKFARIWSKKESCINRVVRVIYRDTKGNLWFGASSNLVVADSKERFFDGVTIRAITEDGTGRTLGRQQ